MGYRMRPNKFIALFDIHCGWESQTNRGKTTIKPTHSLPAVRAAVKFAKDFRPDVFILGGDQLNCGPISHWRRGKPKLTEGLRLKDEFDLLLHEVMEPLQFVKRKVWHDGNHEQWIIDHVEENPSLAGILEPAEYLKLEKRGYEIYSQGEVSSVGKLHFVHGDVILRSGGGTNPAKKLVNAYRRNIRAGHIHTYGAHIETTAVDVQDYHSGVIVPSLSVRNPTYAKFCPNNSLNGFLYGYSWPNGSFSDEVVIINKGECTVHGIKYSGN
jgi:hypothetical protein